MTPPRRAGGSPVLGLILLVIGVVLLLHNIGVWDYDLGFLIRTFWPLILIFVGGKHLIEGRLASGAMLLLLGGIFQLAALDLINRGTVGRWWPLALVGIGGWLVFRTFRPSGEPAPLEGSKAVEGEDSFRVFQMWGGTRRVITSQAFRGGEATAFMGGVDLDLRQASPAGGVARVDVTAIMGGVEVSVPEDWEVNVTGSPFMGAIEDNRGPRKPREGDVPPPRLEIRATILMGGFEIS